MIDRLRGAIRLQIIVEILLVLLVVWLATGGYRNFSTRWRLSGGESEYLTSSAVWVSTIFRQSGYVPQWQPYLDAGQPAVDEAYSFMANPFYAVPVLLSGGINGLKIAVIVHFAIAGLGGWFLGWVLGWRGPARVLTGCLLVLKANMQSVIGMGFMQLGTTQAYFPWVMAGGLAIIRLPHKRWPPVLLGLALGLLFLGGNLYNILPALILVGLIVVVYCLRLSPDFSRIELDQPRIRGFALAIALMIGLCAVTAVTVGLNFGLVKAHPNEVLRQTGDPLMVFFQFFSPEVRFDGLFAENLYGYSMPGWFALVIFVLLPPIPGVLHRRASPEQGWRFWAMMGLAFLLFFTWGLGINPVINWMYENIPLIAQWRFVERMNTVAAFLLIVFAGLRVDGLLRALDLSNRQNGRRLVNLGALLATGVLVLGSGVSVMQVYNTRATYDFIWDVNETPGEELLTCVRWLREQYPDEFLQVYRREYDYVTAFVTEQVRMVNVGAEYDLSGVASTLYPYDLTNEPVEFYMPQWDEPPEYMTQIGYQPMTDSPWRAPDSDTPCMWRHPGTLSVAFTAPLEQLREAPFPLPLSLTTPATILGRTPEHIWLEAMPSPDEEVVAVTQDIAYPGWIALVDGSPAEVQSVGELLGVVLPPGSQAKRVEFIYTAPTLKLGGSITVLAALFAIGWLVWPNRTPRLAADAAAATVDAPTTVPDPVNQPSSADEIVIVPTERPVVTEIVLDEQPRQIAPVPASSPLRTPRFMAAVSLMVTMVCIVLLRQRRK